MSLDLCTKKYKTLVEGDVIVLNTGRGDKFYAVDVPLVVMGIDTHEIWITEVNYNDGACDPVGDSIPLPVTNPEYFTVALK